MSNGTAGWAIGPGPEDPRAEHRSDEDDAKEIYEKLDEQILPLYYDNRDEWIERMKNAIKLGAHFNTQRVVADYAERAWGMKPQKPWALVEND